MIGKMFEVKWVAFVSHPDQNMITLDFVDDGNDEGCHVLYNFPVFTSFVKLEDYRKQTIKAAKELLNGGGSVEEFHEAAKKPANIQILANDAEEYITIFLTDLKEVYDCDTEFAFEINIKEPIELNGIKISRYHFFRFLLLDPTVVNFSRWPESESGEYHGFISVHESSGFQDG